MTPEERMEIVRACVVAGMWGHMGVVGIVLEELDKRLPETPTLRQLLRDNEKRIRREHIGVIDDEARLQSLLSLGYWLTNFDVDGCMLFNPPPMNGLAYYVSRRLARLYPHRDINRAINEKLGLYDEEPS